MGITVAPQGVAAAVEAVKEQAPQQAQETQQQPPKQVEDPRLAAYARKEQQLRQQLRQLEEREQAMLAKEQEYQTNYLPKSRLTEDPLSVLTEAGVGYDKLTELMLQQPNDPATKALMAKMRTYEEKLQAIERQSAEREQAQYQQALKQIDTEAKLLVDADPEFESIKSAGMHAAVTELIEQTFNKEGRLMDVREAALEVETYLVNEALKMAQLSKVQAKLKPVQAETLPAESQQKQSQTPIKTLTNKLPTQPTKRTSERERVARAIAAFKGEKL